MKKLFLILAVMAFGFCAFAQEIDLDDALAEEPQVIVVQQPQPQPTIPVVQPTQTTVRPEPAKTVTTVTDTPPIKQATVSYSQLSPSDREKFNTFARQAAYGTLIQKDLTGCTIKSVTTVRGVPSRSGRRMTQYVVIYLDENGEKQGLLMTDNPLVQGGCTPCYVRCMIATPGYHQGDDTDIPNKPKTGENHQISQDW
jgi:hypothetical protein